MADDLVDQWIRRLPGEADLVIVSLLGRKHGPSGISEFSFYSFSGGFDSPSERGGRPSFQQWLDRRHKKRSILVVEHPTYDFCPVPQETLDVVVSQIFKSLKEEQTVVLVDSGGQTRTGKVCTFMGAVDATGRTQ